MINVILKILFITLIILIFNNSFVYAQAEMEGDTSKSISLKNPLGQDTNDINTLIGQVIKGVLGVIGAIALAMFVYGGFIWMTAAGNEQRVAQGKAVLIWATLGLIVIFSSFVLLQFIFATVAGTALG